ncbi:MAG: type I glyceraldehyde-3-phosphate dehydrogenase [Deltaproteobacteria bacterium]|nr:type I glyceraldehyde-3-phosphate dehydrogenase [Deltaproteobacteria bacterium]
MTYRIAINGFGRIGRQILRLAQKPAYQNLEIVAINDLSDAKILGHLFKYDSVHGTYAGTVSTQNSNLVVDGKTIQVLQIGQVDELPWKKLKIDLVLECTGHFTKDKKAFLHLKAGAKKVIISAPSSDADLGIVMGMNEDRYDPKQHHVISNASCTTNCLGMITKVLHEAFFIEKASMTTIHAYTKDQRLLDAPHSDLRRARAAGVSMIPTTTGAAKAITALFPHLKNKFHGISIRVPTTDVSLVDLGAVVQKKTSVQKVNEVFRKAAFGSLKKFLGYTEEPLVSCDFLKDERSAIVDALSTEVIDETFVKIVAWYDNEIGFSARMLDLAEHLYAHPVH